MVARTQPKRIFSGSCPFRSSNLGGALSPYSYLTRSQEDMAINSGQIVK
jgi:hypothetical protein